jgi:hypothetical protein
VPHKYSAVIAQALTPLLIKAFDESMWRSMMAWLAQHGRSRYVLLLEEEVARLRAENRALVNSLLGTAGFPPISPEDDARRGAVGLPPVRRRTWSQIARERELAAGRGAVEK